MGTGPKHGLVNIVKKIDAKTVAEIGIKEGRTTKTVLIRCPGIEKYYMIDPFRSYADLGEFDRSPDQGTKIKTNKMWDGFAFTAYKEAMRDDRARLIRLSAVSAAALFPNDFFDVVYIDTDHSYMSIVEETKSYILKVRDGGMISGHDYTPGWIQVVLAVHDLFGEEFGLISGASWYMQVDNAKKNVILEKIRKIEKEMYSPEWLRERINRSGEMKKDFEELV